MSRMLSRRNVLRGSLAVAAGAAGVGAAGCSSTAPATSGKIAVAAAGAVPTYIPISGGPKPDFPGSPNGAVDGFLHYPKDPAPIWKGAPPGDGKPVTGLAQLNGTQPPTLAHNMYWQELNKRLGSPIQVQLINAGDDFNSKIATLSAGNDFPDLMQVNSSIPALDQFLEAKMLDLTSYLGGDNAKQYPALANIPTKFWQAGVFGGKLYALPISRGIFSSGVMYRRSDVLTAAGVEPKVGSFQDFYDLCKAVTNAKAGRWALASSPLQYVRMMLNIPCGWQQNSDGSIVNSVESNSQVEALTAARKLVADGFINPDFASASPAQSFQWFASSKAAFLFQTFSAWSGLYTQFGVPHAAIGILPIPGYSGGTGTGWIGALNNNLTVIPASAQSRAETILKIADYLASPFGTEEYRFLNDGIEGHNYKLSGSDPILITANDAELTLGTNYLSSPPQVLYNASVPGYVEGEYKAQQQFAKHVSTDISLRYYSETASRLGPQLTALQSSAETDILTGRKSPSSWSDFVSQWKSTGGDKIRKELQAATTASGGK